MNVVWHEVNRVVPQAFIISDNVTQIPTINSPGPTGTWASFVRDGSTRQVGSPRNNTQIPSPRLTGRPTDARAAMVIFLFRAANELSLDRAVNWRLHGLEWEFRRRMRAHRTGGILAVVLTRTTFDPNAVLRVGHNRPIQYFNQGPNVQTIAETFLLRGIYSQPVHAISVHRHERNYGYSLQTGTDDSNSFINDPHYFWGVWEGVYRTR
jgi:hypothetical protein